MIEFKHEQISQDTDNRDIADLCNMCGKCCRAIVTDFSHKELQQMAKENKREAKVFVDFFKKYDTIEDAKKAVPDQIEQVIKIKSEESQEAVDKLSFYYCDYIDTENKCTIHKERPLCCRMAPLDGWAAMPPGCGYEGWQFEQREKIKATVRGLKEALYRAELLLNPEDTIEEINMTLNDFKADVTEKIKIFDRYGAQDW